MHRLTTTALETEWQSSVAPSATAGAPLAWREPRYEVYTAWRRMVANAQLPLAGAYRRVDDSVRPRLWPTLRQRVQGEWQDRCEEGADGCAVGIRRHAVF